MRIDENGKATKATEALIRWQPLRSFMNRVLESKTMAFDAYRKWLGISSKRRPPTFYDLLGVEPGENDTDVILSALQQRRTFIRSKKGEGYDAQVRTILGQFDEAASTLLVPEFKNAYDRQLGLHLKWGRKGGRRRSYLLPSWMETRIVRIYGEGSGVLFDALGIISIIAGAIAIMVLSGLWLKSQPIESESPSELTWMEKAAVPTTEKTTEPEPFEKTPTPVQPDDLKALPSVSPGNETNAQDSHEKEDILVDPKSGSVESKPLPDKKAEELQPEKKPVIANLGPPPALAAPTPLIRAIDRLVAAEGVTDDSPGVAIYIIQPGRWIFIKGYGRANLKTGDTITSKTIFETGSLTKPMIATAVLLLQDQGKLSIDDDVRTFVPELPQYDAARPIRLRDLLNHTSGLPDYKQFKRVTARHKDFWVNEDYADVFAENLASFPLTFPTGEQFEHSNSNYMLLGLVVARVSGKPFAKFMRDDVFSLVGMVDTFVYENPRTVRAVGDRQPAAIGYRQASDEPWKPTWGLPPNRNEEQLAVGESGVWTNLEDMARWDMAWRFAKFLKPETAAGMVFPSKTNDGNMNNYGLGFAIYPNNMGGLLGFGHSGDWGGFRTDYYRYFAADRTSVILSNREDFDTDSFWYKLNDAAEKVMKNK